VQTADGVGSAVAEDGAEIVAAKLAMGIAVMTKAGTAARPIAALAMALAVAAKMTAMLATVTLEMEMAAWSSTIATDLKIGTQPKDLLANSDGQTIPMARVLLTRGPYPAAKSAANRAARLKKARTLGTATMVVSKMRRGARVAGVVGAVEAAEGVLVAHGSLRRRTVGPQRKMWVPMGMRVSLMSVLTTRLTRAIATAVSPCQQALARVLNLPARKMICLGMGNLNELKVAHQPVPERRNHAPVN